MRQVLDRIDIGDVDGDLVALLDLELLEPERRRGRGHVDAHLVAVADDLGIRLEIDAVGLGLLDRIRKHRIGAVPDRDRIDLGTVHDGGVMRLGEARAVVDQHHLVAGDVDQLVVLRLQRADVEEAILRELVQRDQPFSVRLLGLTHRGMVVAGLIVHVELLDDGIDLLALERPFGEIDVPLADLAVEEQRRIGVALAVVGRMQRPEAEFGLGDHDVARLDLVVEQLVEQPHVHHRHRRRKLAGRDDMDAVGRGVHAVRIVRDRNVARVGRPLAAVEHGHAVHFLEVALLDRLLDPLEVEDDDPILLVGGHLGQGDAFLAVVAGREAVFALIVGIDVVEIAADDHLPGDLHGVAVERA